ncbi:MAG: hypothetical protein GX088_00565 [Clostridia bacterium]|nr:hypothetical protein [Clostridia bacterium]
MNQPGSIAEKKFKINTLGSFCVVVNGEDVTSALSKSAKVWDLFKYLITFRDELILPEKIISSLWPDADYTDPKRTLRALIFRLRRALKLGEKSGSNCIIVSSHGCYKFATKDCCELDVVEFENAFHKAYEHRSRDEEEKAVELFKKLIYLYKGEYLSQTYGYDWLIPARNYYRRMFLQSVCEVSEMLRERKQYEEILSICELALKHEMYEEQIHFYYMEALAGTGRLKQARSHYEHIERLFEKELGVKPSTSLERLYRMLFGEVTKSGLDISYIKEGLREEALPCGPVFCDKEFFKTLRMLEKRRAERYGPMNFLGLLTITNPDRSLPDRATLDKGRKLLKQLLLSNLRKGDVVTQWNEAQFLLSLPSLNVKQAEVALKRMQKKFAALENNPGLVVYYDIKETLPSE